MDREQLQTSTEFRGERSRKFLEASKVVTDYQKQYYQELKERSAQGEKVIWTNVGVPMEILHAMDIPVIFNPHWSAITAAKQMSAHYLDRMNERGYFRDLCRYCSMPLGYFFDDKPELAPWGGVPKPDAIIMDMLCDPIVKIGELMGRELGVPFYFWDRGMIATPPVHDVWEKADDFEVHTYKESWSVDYAVKETEGFINFLEALTGKHLKKAKLREAMERSNEQFEIIGEVMDLAARVPTPMRMGDHMANLISTQFYRGHEFGLAQAKRLYEEVKERVDKEVPAYKNERIRLMFSGVPNWFTPGFYDSFEEQYGAVFVWMGYLTMVPRSLIRKDLSDPLRAVAARYVNYAYPLHPPWFSSLLLREAKKFKIDGIVLEKTESCRFLSGPTQICTRILEKHGIPSFVHEADMVDARDWDDSKMKTKMINFIEMIEQGK
jgi:benzoyl-CoA reductase/2-hydroxyglutaryl-CoA dehydratase subunit BcrC/BadD/HgdB